MTDSEDSPACALRNAEIDVGALIFEIRTVLEALSHGTKVLLKKHQNEPIKNELLVLENFSNHAVEAMGSLEEQMEVLFGLQQQTVPQA